MPGSTPSAQSRPGARAIFVRLAKSFLFILAATYLIVLTFLYVLQRKMMNFPCAETPKAIQTRAQQEGFQSWTNHSGQMIGWHRPYKAGGSTLPLVFFHGNAGCAIDRTGFADQLQRIAPLDVYLVEYPGFGGRTQSPSQEAISAAAREAFQAVATKGKVYVAGESLGTGVASYVAGAFPSNVAGVLLMAPFNNMAAAARSHYPFIPAGWVLKDTYRSDMFLKSYQGPLAVLLAAKDEVVPSRLGRKLFDDYAGPKKVWISDTATHNTAGDLDEQKWREVFGFLHP